MSRPSVLIFIFFCSTLFSEDVVDYWINRVLIPLDSATVSVQFTYEITNEFSEYMFSGNLIVDEDRKRFRYTLGPKTTLFDGIDWFLQDERTDHIIIEGGQNRPVLLVPGWVVSDSIKALIRVPGELSTEFTFSIPEVSDSVIVQFSNEDSSLKMITFKYEMSEVQISDIILSIPENDTDWFSIDTTGKYILDLRE